MNFSLDLCHLHTETGPDSSAKIRQENSCFQVDEILGFELAGEGDHLYVKISKEGQNTGWVKEQLAAQLNIDLRDIGHSGLKDRHAVTSQWLSIYAPKTEPAPSDIQIDGVRVLQSKRHRQKLKPGMHQSNRFKIRLTEFDSDRAQTEAILGRIQTLGLPNYFGDQRFGREGANLPKAWALLTQRRLNKHKKKSIYLSSLRSFLFNRVLDACVSGRHSLSKRLLESIDSTGPLWGRGRLSINGEQAELEQAILEPWKEICEALEYSGLRQERRKLQVVPEGLNWRWMGEDQLELAFHLPSGCYATSLLREVANIIDHALVKKERSDDVK